MNRLVRIALTLFVSSTILIFLVLQRLERAKEASALRTPGGTGELAQSELQMAYVGMGLVGLMLTIGIVLIITAIVRARKSTADPHG